MRERAHYIMRLMVCYVIKGNVCIFCVWCLVIMVLMLCIFYTCMTRLLQFNLSTVYARCNLRATACEAHHSHAPCTDVVYPYSHTYSLWMDPDSEKLPKKKLPKLIALGLLYYMHGDYDLELL